jgi:hypothetical protein
MYQQNLLLQCNFIPGTRKYTNGHQRFCASIFFTPTNIDEIMTIIKDLKNQKSSGLDGFQAFS